MAVFKTNATYFLGQRCQKNKIGKTSKASYFMKLLTCPKCKRIFRKKIGLKLHAKFSHGKTLELLTRQVKRPRKMQKYYDISSSSDDSDNDFSDIKEMKQVRRTRKSQKFNKKSILSDDSDNEIEVLEKNFHQVQKDNKCNYCEKSFFHSEGLKIHPSGRILPTEIW